MKTISAILVAVAATLALTSLTSCEDKPKNQVWDMDAMVSLRPAAGVKADANPEHLSAIEIVKQVESIRNQYKGKSWGRGFSAAQRDTLAPKLKMWGSDIIHEGKYVPDFIESTDAVLVTFDFEKDEIKDTIAYVPNAVLRTAQPLIKTAYDAGDYNEVYRLFDQAFTFIPITGEEWRALKDRGEN